MSFHVESRSEKFSLLDIALLKVGCWIQVGLLLALISFGLSMGSADCMDLFVCLPIPPAVLLGLGRLSFVLGDALTCVSFSLHPLTPPHPLSFCSMAFSFVLVTLMSLSSVCVFREYALFQARFDVSLSKLDAHCKFSVRVYPST